MATFFCPYTGKDVDAERGSLEHVIPESLGGTKIFAVTVEKQANNFLGSEVDEPVVDLYFHRRIKFDLRGHSGRAPRWEATVTVDALAGHLARWEVTQSESQLRLKPQVTKTQLPQGETSVTVSGDPAEATAIFENLRRAYEAKGKKLQLGKFPVKVALGVGHWLWGESWSRSAAADALRRALWSKTMSDLNVAAKDGVTALDPSDLGLRVEEAEHGLLVSPLPDGSAGLGIFPFGQRGWSVKLGPIPAREPIMVIVDVRARTVRRLSSVEMLSESRFRLPDDQVNAE